MDFFEHQAKASRASKLLIFNFVIALIVITLGFNLVGLITWTMTTQPEFNGSFKALIHLWLESRYSWQTSVGTLLFIGSVSFTTWLTLRQGGGRIAKMMGGRAVPTNTQNTDEKKLLNVVEEMALAAGLSVPELYIMDSEHSLNAFAAGYSPNEAAICVTRGLLISLTRDELQGVIAHEFSHILNGDMRINIRLMSILSGLIAIGQLGRWLIDVGFNSGSHSKGGNIAFVFLGIMIWFVGSLGVLCSRVIKAAISRQREFLADASAVQFTRQTNGLTAALYKISTHRYGSNLKSRHAEDLSHMCIGQTMSVHFSGVLSTHPPIDERINRLEPHFITKEAITAAQARKEEFTATTSKEQQAVSPQSNTTNYGTSSISETAPSGALQESEMVEFVSPYQQSSVQQAIDSIGVTDEKSMLAAKVCLTSLNPALLAGLHQPDYAQHILLLLLSKANSKPNEARTLLLTEILQDQETIASHYSDLVNSLNQRPIFPLLQLGISSLRTLEKKEKRLFLSHAKRLIASDNKVKPEELFIYLVLFRHLNAKASRAKNVEFKSIKPLLKDIQILFSFLTNYTDSENRQSAYEQSMQPFTNTTLSYINPNSINHNQLASAIFRIEHLAPLLKRSLLNAILDIFSHDDMITHHETDWLRMLSDCWDCPLPLIDK